MRACSVVLVAALALVAGCGGTKKCKSKTALVTVELDAVSAAADSLSLVITVAGDTETRAISHSPGVDQGTVEIDFAGGYPAGQTLNVEVDATAAGVRIGTGSTTATLAPTCGTLEVDVTATAPLGSDLSIAANDLSTTTDLAGQQFSTDFATCANVFVSPSGDDGNSGCDPSVPLKTIGAALAVATATDIRVCKGTYPEHFQVTTTLALHGGYDCASWTRTANFGYPSFDGVDETVVAPTTVGTVLSVNATGVTVEGFTIQGPDGPGATTVAMVIASAGAAVVHDNKILGGGNSAASGGFGSIALNILSTTMSDVFGNRINGGSGSSTSLTAAGSVGVVLGNPGLSHLHGNTITGGTGTDSSATVSATMLTGAVGVFLQANATAFTAANSNAIEQNFITGGGPGTSSTTVGSTGAGAIGVRIANTQTGAVDLLGNTIDAGNGAGGSTANTMGVALLSASVVNIKGNRINGGTAVTTPATDSIRSGTIGIYASNGTVTIVDNMIHGGNTGTYSLNAEGIFVNTPNTKIQHNTIFGGRTANVAAPPAYGLGVHVLASGTVVENNLIMGLGPSIAVYSEECTTLGPLASYQGNATAYAMVFGYGVSVASPCTAGQMYSTVPSAVTQMGMCTATTSGPCTTFGGTQDSDNVYTAATCTGGDLTCIVDSSCVSPFTNGSNPSTCANTLFASFDTGSDGLLDLLGAGWKLKTNVPCAISKSQLDDSTSVTTDLYGSLRTSPPSIGAYEFDGTCM